MGLQYTDRIVGVRSYQKFAHHPCHDEWIRACSHICCDSLGLPSLWADASDYARCDRRYDHLKISSGCNATKHS